MSFHVYIRPEWFDEVDKVLQLPRYAPVLRADEQTQQRWRRGFVAERAVIHYLLHIADIPITWESAQAEMFVSATTLKMDKRAVSCDVRWGNRDIDVKLISSSARELHVKRGASHLDHIFTCWVPGRVDETLDILGILPGNQPETFSPTVPLKAASGSAYMSTHTKHPVNGWVLPRARLVPLTTLLQEQADVK